MANMKPVMYHFEYMWRQVILPQMANESLKGLDFCFTCLEGTLLLLSVCMNVARQDRFWFLYQPGVSYTEPLVFIISCFFTLMRA